MSVSEHRRAVAKFLASHFGGKMSVQSFHTANRRREIDILKCEGAPSRGVSSFATVGLSEVPLVFKRKEYPVRIELVGANASDFECYGEMLSSAAFTIMNRTKFAAPGTVLRDIVGMHAPRSPMRHSKLPPAVTMS